VRELQAARGTTLSARVGRLGLVLGVAGTIVVIDQLVKLWAVAALEDRDPIVIVDGWFQLRLIRNFGAAFSFGSGATWLFTLVAIVVTIVVIRTARTLTSDAWAWALGALLGGAVGNLIDRLVRDPGGGRGGVVDYFDVPWFSVFNLADVSLTFAAVGVAILALRGVPMTDPAVTGSSPPDAASPEPPSAEPNGDGRLDP
jgi:signal peptidase II